MQFDKASEVSLKIVARLRGERIVCLSTIDWGFLWQGHQEVMSRLAARGNDVVFVENMGGVRTVRWSDARRIVSRLRDVVMRRVRDSTTPIPHLQLVAPLLLPFPRSRLARTVNHFLIGRMAAKIRPLVGADPVIFSFLPTPEALELIGRIRGPRSVLVYYCVADFAELAQDQDRVVASEARLVREADLVFVNSARFAQRFAPLNPRVFDFPGGVSLDQFHETPASDIPADVRRLPAPRIGYVGGLHTHLDVVLLRTLARKMPEASIVLIGPTLADVGELHAEPNIHLLGPRPWPALPAYLSAFEVGLIPYVRSPYTETVYPTKLFEYLAMGLPVVTTKLPEVERLDLPEFAVRIAPDHQSFVRAVQLALADQGPVAAEQRRGLARQRDWSAIVEKMEDLISEQRAVKPPGPVR